CGTALAKSLEAWLFGRTSDAMERRRKLFGWSEPSKKTTLASKLLLHAGILGVSMQAIDPPPYVPLEEHGDALLRFRLVARALGMDEIPESALIKTVSSSSLAVKLWLGATEPTNTVKQSANVVIVVAGDVPGARTKALRSVIRRPRPEMHPLPDFDVVWLNDRIQ